MEKNELKDKFIDKVEKQLQKHNVTFVFGAKDTEHNQADDLKEWMKENWDSRNTIFFITLFNSFKINKDT